MREDPATAQHRREFRSQNMRLRYDILSGMEIYIFHLPSPYNGVPAVLRCLTDGKLLTTLQEVLNTPLQLTTRIPSSFDDIGFAVNMGDGNFYIVKRVNLLKDIANCFRFPPIAWIIGFNDINK